MKPYEQLLNGSIHIERNFFEEELYKKISKEIVKLKYSPGYQPGSYYYGNRFQGYPSHECGWSKYKKIIVNKIEHLLGCKIKDVSIKVRRTDMDEVARSKFNTTYGLVHSDPTDFGAILCFNQTSSGGTAFFEYHFDKYPDISIGAFPNRMIIFRGGRNHTAQHDFTFESVYKLLVFFNKDKI